jgi:hypothetical protein
MNINMNMNKTHIIVIVILISLFILGILSFIVRNSLHKRHEKLSQLLSKTIRISLRPEPILDELPFFPSIHKRYLQFNRYQFTNNAVNRSIRNNRVFNNIHSAQIYCDYNPTCIGFQLTPDKNFVPTYYTDEVTKDIIEKVHPDAIAYVKKDLIKIDEWPLADDNLDPAT